MAAAFFMVKEKILPVKRIKVVIPRKKLIKLYYAKRYLTPMESAKLCMFLRVVEKNIIMLRHVESIVGNVLLKSLSHRE